MPVESRPRSELGEQVFILLLLLAYIMWVASLPWPSPDAPQAAWYVKDHRTPIHTVVGGE